MYDVIIIGGGAAGSMAAVTSARNCLKTLLLDKGPQFSVLGHTASAGDMPGFPEGIAGAELLAKIKKQAEGLGAEIKNASATSCTFNDTAKKVVTNEPFTYEAKTVILATGNLPQQANFTYQGEEKFAGRGISHDVEADAASCRHQPVAIIGKTASVAETAIYLSNFAEKIYWIIPASKIDIPNELKNKLEQIKRIEVFYSSSLKQINGTNEMTSVTILSAGHEKNLNVKFLFLPTLQHRPVTNYLSGTGLQVNSEGCIMVSQEFGTSIKGVFAAGNILCTKPQLNVVCAAQGAIAALNAKKYLSA